MKHGVRSKLYNKWHSMKNRCNNTKSKDYKIMGEEVLEYVRSG